MEVEVRVMKSVRFYYMRKVMLFAVGLAMDVGVVVAVGGVVVVVVAMVMLLRKECQDGDIRHPLRKLLVCN